MKRLSISLSNKSPFSIASSRTVSNVQESLDFIGGTHLRGALAGIWLKGKKPDNDFKELFTGDKVAFSNLYIQGANPVPLSARSCKYHGGFKGDKDKHGVRDILLSLIKETENRGHIPDEFQHCPYLEEDKPCSAPLEKFRGYYLKDISDGSFKSVMIKKRLIYHTAISHISESALEGALYSQEVVESGQIFQGNICVYDDDILAKLQSFINSQEILYLGSDKSTGLGRFEIRRFEMTSSEINDILDMNDLRERISLFNQRLGLDNEKTYFSVTLYSDAIIADKYMRYKTFIEPEDLSIEGAELINGIAKSILVQGWNAMAKLPKEDVIALQKGSVFVFSANNLNSILSRLHDAETFGIGKRRGEGFGRLKICDPFHLQEDLK